MNRCKKESFMVREVPPNFWVFSLSLIITFICISVSYQAQRTYRVSEFENLAERNLKSLEVVIENDVQQIGSGANFFRASDKDNWANFKIFAQHTIDNSQSLVGLQWMQRVEVQDIEQHIENVSKLFPDYSIFTIPKDGVVTPGYILPNHEPIYVATDIYPRTEENTRLLGFYSSRKRFELILDGMTQSGEPNLSDKVRLLQDSLNQSDAKNGMLVYFPVFEFQTRELIGVVIGVIRTSAYFDNLVTKTSAEQTLLIQVVDVGFDAEDDPVLYQSEGWSLEQGAITEKVIHLPNRDWVVKFKMPQKFCFSDFIVLLGIFLAGFIISLLLAHIVKLQSRERERLSLMLADRTKELQFLVEHDSLTELLNRRAFNGYIEHVIGQSNPFSLVSFDIDHFKLINDQYGHVCGDEMLIHVAHIITSELKGGDCFYRIGGDEFSIISYCVDPVELECYLNQIRLVVERSRLVFGQNEISCTLSVGAVTHLDEDTETLLQKADIQLYHSKKHGRNRVSIAL